MYKLYSTLFMEQDAEPYNCYVNETLWKRITNDLMASRILIRINNGTDFWICSLGHPIYTSFDSLGGGENTANHIYVPNWMIEQIKCQGIGEDINVDWFPSDIFDYSTKIILQPHTSIVHFENIQDILSNELTKLAVLKKGTTIEVYMPDLIKFDVVGLEPANIVLCEGDEVELEFMESLDSIVRSPTPYPLETLPTELYTEPSAPLSEELQAPVPVLGGIKREGRYNPWRDKDYKPNSS